MIAFLINTLLAEDPETAAKLFAHQNKIVQITLLPLKMNFFISIKANNIAISRTSEKQPNTVICGTPLNLISQKNLDISGDLDLAQTLQLVSQQLDIDWEEMLSHYTNDYVAYGARKTFQRFKKITRTFSRNLKDYLEEEQRLIVSREEIQDFCKEVDEIRDAVERLSIKIAMIDS